MIRAGFIAVKVPAVMSGPEFFAGEDPVLDAILSAPAPYPTLDHVLIEQGAEAAVAAYRERVSTWGDLDYWQPVGRMDMEFAAERLEAEGRRSDAMTAYEINTWVFPDDWDTWDDLGDVCLRSGMDECVVGKLFPRRWS